MTPERWQQIKKLLDAHAEIDTQQTAGWLDEVCGDDTALRQELASYLAYEDDLDELNIASPAAPLLEALDETYVADEGRLIGPYRIESLLGRGGMGAVYRARREAEFEQRVALKLVRKGFETPETLKRFHTERQLLARLEHPNIARLLDGGTSEEGRPYFVMELVEGMPIDRYCDEHRLSVRARLVLILQICDALRFAHRNLVLHLDLKPGNILVTEEGVAKLLDFGIGKLLGEGMEEKLSSAGSVTGPGPLTLGYASPEQLLGGLLTTASDLYSLGTVLFELLTGRLPCGAAAADWATMVKAICHTAPPHPSTAVLRAETVGFGDRRGVLAPQAVAATRERSPAVLHRRLRGDVDAILLKALGKEPAQRYASVEQLAADIGRHLHGLPVAARPGTLAYRAGKYVRRHRWSLTVAATVLTVIIAFTAALSNQLQRTERQRERAERLSGFLVDLFRAAEPDRAGEEPSVRELIDIGRQRLETELAEEPEVRAQLLGTLGQVYYRLGHFDAAKEAKEMSIAVFQQEGDRDDPNIAAALNDLSAVAFEQGAYQQAEAYLRESIAMRQRLGAEADLTKPRNNLAAILTLRGELVQAEAIFRDSLKKRRAVLGDRHPNIALSLRSLATVLYLGGDFAAAEPLLQESLDIRLEAFGRDTASVATALASLGRLAHARGELDTAESYYREALDIRRHRLGNDHLNVAILEGDVAKLLLERGELDTAAVLLAHAFGPIYRHKPAGDATRAELESIYGAYLAARGRFAAAEVCLTEGARTLEEVRGSDILPTREARRRLAAFRALRSRPPGSDES